eukprot:TRINITY_DN1081_c0_g1_i1.p2 TRINITY_DN1081_c0_g1~~TRINITY_DN1081_c0_g1_i1.p2  ORF type:complete len:214 (+),score=77.32 TRINITY_DN1081_c0_g1_i1:29-643(+)
MAGPKQPASKKQKTEEPDLSNEYLHLEEVQQHLEKLNEEAADEIIKIEKRFNEKRGPFYKDRNEVIKKIPGFWKKTFLNHKMLFDCFNNDDQTVLDSLTELDIEEADDVKGGYKIIFKFKSNPYFKNDSLWKEYKYKEDGQREINVSPIQWKKEIKSEDSFFEWFKLPDEENMDEDDLATIIKEEIWVDPSKYYHGFEDPEDAE